MAHYQLSYGFNSNDPDSTASINNSSTKTTEIQNIENHPESSLNVQNKNLEAEKRKLSQPSEPGKPNKPIFIY